ncbi:MAG: hypothetical protein WCI74_06105 [Actinomycetes bacterium]
MTAVVLTLLLIPGSSVPTVVTVPHIDLVVHVVLFLAWGLALAHDVPAVGRNPSLVLPAVLVFGLLSESLQLLASERSFDLLDLAADLIGGALAVVVISIQGHGSHTEGGRPPTAAKHPPQ